MGHIGSETASRESTVTGRSRYLGVPTLVLACSTIACAVGLFEYFQYSEKVLRLRLLRLDLFDRVLVYWSLVAKTAVLLLPILVVASILTKCRPRSAYRYWLCNWGVPFAICVVAGWLAIESQLMAMTGNHLDTYAEALVHVENWGWGGDFSDIPLTLIKTFSGVALASAVVLGVSHYTSTLELWSRFQKPRRLFATSVIFGYAALMYGVIPARAYATQPIALERLYAILPTQAVFFPPEAVARPSELAFGEVVDGNFQGVGKLAVESVPQAPLSVELLLPSTGNRPNVVLFVVESFQHSTVNPAHMPKLAKLARKGLTCSNHYCNANRSNHGTYSLLYGLNPVWYDKSMDADQPATLCEGFRRAGYARTLVGSCHFNHGRMEEFMNDQNFDEVLINNGESFHENDWKSLADVRRLLKRDSEQPQFIVVYWFSTHYGYDYAEAQDKRLADAEPDPRPILISGSWAKRAAELRKRYRKSLAFTDDEIGKLIEESDLDRNLFIVTGDHGESIFHDGFLAHSSGLSEIQTRSPMLLIGAGTPHGYRVDRISGHVDLIPTLADILGGQVKTTSSATGVFGKFSGTSLVREAIHDQEVLVQDYPESWELMLVRRDGRLKLSVNKSTGVTRALGFCDENGSVRKELVKPPSEISTWVAGFTDELSRTVR